MDTSAWGGRRLLSCQSSATPVPWPAREHARRHAQLLQVWAGRCCTWRKQTSPGCRRTSPAKPFPRTFPLRQRDTESARSRMNRVPSALASQAGHGEFLPDVETVSNESRWFVGVVLAIDSRPCLCREDSQREVINRWSGAASSEPRNQCSESWMVDAIRALLATWPLKCYCVCSGC